MAPLDEQEYVAADAVRANVDSVAVVGRLAVQCRLWPAFLAHGTWLAAAFFDTALIVVGALFTIYFTKDGLISQS